MKFRFLKLFIALLVAGMLLLNAGLALAECPQITDNNIIDYAKTGVGSPYWWGHGCWKTTDRKWGGADCSGFAAKSWQVPYWTATTTDHHPYSTYDFYWKTYHWYSISRSNIWKGDSLVWRSADNTKGHIVVFYYYNAYGTPCVYEAKDPSSGIVFNARSFGSEYKTIRRHNLTQTPGPA